ncbi:MAG: HypC/HybG/HupF family hydrogenase formation chaperone [Bryobacteraceae bacterium]|nr:HypC/HybG/HupF family hydrogenase formation chaperone [Solibacteraceae bacterium]MCO5353171.1 HypC/HybG/HupF family hydrogenase formation chaperone [Bryobacteraceae bacterium]
MCLAVPARVEEIRGTRPEFLCGIVDFGGVRREVSLAFTPAAQPGDYVLVHAGFALEVVDEKEASTRLAALRALGLDDEATP